MAYSGYQEDGKGAANGAEADPSQEDAHDGRWEDESLKAAGCGVVDRIGFVKGAGHPEIVPTEVWHLFGAVGRRTASNLSGGKVLGL